MYGGFIFIQHNEIKYHTFNFNTVGFYSYFTNNEISRIDN